MAAATMQISQSCRDRPTVVVDAAAEFNGLDNRREVIVGQDYPAGFFRDFGARLSPSRCRASRFPLYQAAGRCAVTTLVRAHVL